MQKSNILSEAEIEKIENETDFVLNDGGVDAQVDQLSFDQMTVDGSVLSAPQFALTDVEFIAGEDMASDEEILAAEMEIDSSDIQLNVDLIKNIDQLTVAPAETIAEIEVMIAADQAQESSLDTALLDQELPLITEDNQT